MVLPVTTGVQGIIIQHAECSTCNVLKDQLRKSESAVEGYKQLVAGELISKCERLEERNGTLSKKIKNLKANVEEVKAKHQQDYQKLEAKIAQTSTEKYALKCLQLGQLPFALCEALCDMHFIDDSAGKHDFNEAAKVGFTEACAVIKAKDPSSIWLSDLEKIGIESVSTLFADLKNRRRTPAHHDLSQIDKQEIIDQIGSLYQRRVDKPKVAALTKVADLLYNLYGEL